MKKLFLRLFGAALASRLGFFLLTTYAFRTPHRHLRDLDGSLYMGRWRVVDEGTLAGRLLEKLTGYASVRLHRIMRADHDRDLHNHPFDYRTFVVKGAYAEVFEEPSEHSPEWRAHGYRWIHAGGTETGNQDKYHRIDVVPKRGVWTLFFMTRNTGGWGFNVDGQHVDSTRYLLRKGYTRTHVEEVQAR